MRPEQSLTACHLVRKFEANPSSSKKTGDIFLADVIGALPPHLISTKNTTISGKAG
jgi:hypothetical protein